MEASSYNEAISKLHEAGVGEEFLKAIDENPELLKSITKIAPIEPVSANWSCCITVGHPVQ